MTLSLGYHLSYRLTELFFSFSWEWFWEPYCLGRITHVDWAKREIRNWEQPPKTRWDSYVVGWIVRYLRIEGALPFNFNLVEVHWTLRIMVQNELRSGMFYTENAKTNNQLTLSVNLTFAEPIFSRAILIKKSNLRMYTRIATGHGGLRYILQKQTRWHWAWIV